MRFVKLHPTNTHGSYGVTIPRKLLKHEGLISQDGSLKAETDSAGSVVVRLRYDEENREVRIELPEPVEPGNDGGPTTNVPAQRGD